MFYVVYIDDLANTATERERVQQKKKYKKPLLIIIYDKYYPIGLCVLRDAYIVVGKY